MAPGSLNARLPLFGVLVLAAVLRFWQLDSMPILYFDSGAYLGEGRFLASAAQRATSAWLQPAPDAPANPLTRMVQAVEVGTAGHPPDLAKPGQSILLAVSILVFGPTTLAAGVVPALAGLGTVALTYAIGSAGWNRRVGVAAAALLAISAEHLVYSREPLVESTGLFFATLAGFVYLRRLVEPRSLRLAVTSAESAPARDTAGEDRVRHDMAQQPGQSSAGRLLLVGALLGAAFACNNRLIYLPVCIGLFELVVTWRECTLQRWRAVVTRLAALAAGFLLPILAIEAAFLAGQSLASAAGSTPGFLDYAHQFTNFMRMNPPSRARLDQWPTFFADLAIMDGLPVLALFLVGSCTLVFRRPWSRADALLAVSLFAPVALFSVYSSGDVRMRNFSVVLPWAMSLAALGLCWLAERTRYPGPVVAVALAALAILALPRDISIVTAPSAMAELEPTLSRSGIDRVASTNGPVLSYYLGEDRTNARLRPAFINTREDLQSIAAEYPFVEVDMQAYWTPGPVTDGAARASPVFQASNGSDAQFLAFLLERHGMGWGEWNDVLEEWRANRAPATQMRLYRSADLL
jgi:4-amino-4-deoxy-L-arabinose transferase-like glycosyltransferase